MTRSRTMTAIGVGLAAALVAGTGSVSADSSLAHSGRYGRHHLADSREYPGARCVYDGDEPRSADLTTIRVRAPFVFARDRSGARDAQTVGWRVQVVGETVHGEPTVVTSRLRTAVAYDDAPAAFTRRAVTLDYEAGRWYWVKVVMYWFRPGTLTTDGWAVHAVDWYSTPTAPRSGPDGFCPGAIL